MSDLPKNLRILIVDDDRHIRKIATMILRNLEGADIAEADCATDAWAKMKSRKFDILIVDWMMKPVSGLQFVKRLRSSPDSPNPNQLVVFMTAHASVDFVKAARSIGVSSILAKPISAKNLLTGITKAIRDHKAALAAKAAEAVKAKARTSNEDAFLI